MDGDLHGVNFELVVPSLAGTSNDTGTVRKNKRRNLDDSGATSDELELDTGGNKTGGNGGEKTNGESSASHRETSFDDDGTDGGETKINLDRGELLKLLSVFEGELQARDEVIAILKSECSNNSEGRYGLACQPLKALQRDATSFEAAAANNSDDSDEDIGAHTKEQLKHIIQQQKESHKRLKQLFLASQDKNQRIMVELNVEKRKQQEYMLKSDDFVNLLEDDRERLKQLLQHEKSSHDRKERELTWKIKESSEELGKMKTLSIELIEERQKQLQSFAEQRQLAASLQTTIEDMKVKVKQSEIDSIGEREHANQLENDLEEQSNKHIQEIEELGNQLRTEEENRTQLREQISTMKRRIKHLQMMDKSLRKTDDQLVRIQEKLNDKSAEKLLNEIESLRSTMGEMEDAEKVYAQTQEEMRELREAFESEVAMSRTLKVEVDKLRKSHKNQIELERCVEESTFRVDEIQHQFEVERKKSEKLKLKFEEFTEQLKKFVDMEEMLQSTQVKLQHTLETVEDLTAERGQLETQLEQAEEKCDQYNEELEEEKIKVANVKQKQIAESRSSLKLKEELAVLGTRHSEENAAMRQHIDSLTSSLSAKEDQVENGQDEDKMHLRRQISALQGRLESTEMKNHQLESQKQEMEQDAEHAKNRLVQSAGKLKELVTSGFNEQLAIVKCDEYAQKIKELETENEKLQRAAEEARKPNNSIMKIKLAPKKGDSYKDLHRMAMSDGEDCCGKSGNGGSPLRPPSRQSIRHAALRKASPSPNKTSTMSQLQRNETPSPLPKNAGQSVTRTSSLKSIRNRTLSSNRGMKSMKSWSTKDESTTNSDVVEGRPPSRASRGMDRTTVGPVSSPRTHEQQPPPPRSRSIVRSRKKESAPPSGNADSSNPKPPPSAKRSKSKCRNKSLTRVANLIKPNSSSSSLSSDGKSKSTADKSSDKKSKQNKVPTGIPKLRSTTPTLLPSAKKTPRSSTKR